MCVWSVKGYSLCVCVSAYVCMVSKGLKTKPLFVHQMELAQPRTSAKHSFLNLHEINLCPGFGGDGCGTGPPLPKVFQSRSELSHVLVSMAIVDSHRHGLGRVLAEAGDGDIGRAGERELMVSAGVGLLDILDLKPVCVCVRVCVCACVCVCLCVCVCACVCVGKGGMSKCSQQTYISVLCSFPS